MYKEHWKLHLKPFENTPDPRFIYWSKKHEEALSRMLYVIREQKGAAILTGEYGSGKTFLSRVLLEELSGDEYQTALIFNPMLPPLELIKEVIYQLGGETTTLTSKTDLLHHLNEILYRNKNDEKITVIVIDEAQAIDEEGSFEELRLLLNFQLNDSFLLNLILLGQPELKEKISKLPQLKQRLALRYHLKALNEKETGEYIQHRLKVAGARQEIFTEEALAEIYAFSQGLPRIINNVCDMALVVGYGGKAEKVDKKLIREVVADLEGEGVEDAEETVEKLEKRPMKSLEKVESNSHG